MKIQICSDLHLEFYTNRKWLEDNPLQSKGKILIIAGDTHYIGEFEKLEFIKRISDEFKDVFIIPGNHEYYNGFDVSTAAETVDERIKENVRFINNKAIEYDGIRLIFSTMWSKISRNRLEIMRGMTDFRKIKYKNERFAITHFNLIHEKSFEFLEREVKKEGKNIVITHHLPSNKCNIERFKNSILNQAFCVEKSEFISKSNISYWVYGHSHGNKENFKINNTTMVTNQLGYVGNGENLSFRREKTIEIENCA